MDFGKVRLTAGVVRKRITESRPFVGRLGIQSYRYLCELHFNPNDPFQDHETHNSPVQWHSQWINRSIEILHSCTFHQPNFHNVQTFH